MNYISIWKGCVKLRDKINEILLTIDSNVYYGMIPDTMEIEDWNYLVFGKQKIKKGGISGIDLTDYYVVTIVREDFIPDDLVFEVIDKITSIPGIRLADGESEYEYTTKGNTNLVVEILPIYFTKTMKRCQ